MIEILICPDGGTTNWRGVGGIEVSEPEGAGTPGTESRKMQRKSLSESTPWEVPGRWDPLGDQCRGAGCCNFGTL